LNRECVVVSLVKLLFVHILLVCSIPIVSIINFGFNFFNIFFNNFSYDGGYWFGTTFASVSPFLVERGNEKDVDKASCEPGEGHHGELNNCVDPAGGKDVTVKLAELEDGHKDGHEVKDP
jgi:hypothetical protein